VSEFIPPHMPKNIHFCSENVLKFSKLSHTQFMILGLFRILH